MCTLNKREREGETGQMKMYMCSNCVYFSFSARLCVKVTLQGRFLFFLFSSNETLSYAPYFHCTLTSNPNGYVLRKKMLHHFNAKN